MSGFGISCKTGFETGLPVLAVQSSSWETATHLNRMDPESQKTISSALNLEWIMSHAISMRTGSLAIPRFPWKPACPPRLSVTVSPSAPAPPRNGSSFPREMSRAPSARPPFARKGISPAAFCWEIPEEIQRVAAGLEIELPKNLEILDPALLRANYVNPLVEMRKHKGLPRTPRRNFSATMSGSARSCLRWTRWTA